MTLQELIDEFRSQVDDRQQPYLWDDEEVLRYAIDAQDVLVQRMGGIADVTAPLADVGTPATRLSDLSLEVANPYTSLSPYILRIRSGTLLTAKRAVVFGNEADMDQVRVSDYGFTVGLNFDDTDTGVVTHGILGIRKNYVRWVRVPADADTCRLHVFRLPYPRIASQEDPLEVDEQHHTPLLYWMKHRAYSKQDAETRDDQKAESNRLMFEDYASTARATEERQRYKPRTVKYGGI